MFPEGSTSNGRYLLQFKRGAFAGSHAVTPVVFLHTYGVMSVALDIVPFFALVMMNMCLFCDSKCEILVLPTFVPNEYLYNTHADKVDIAASAKWHHDHSLPESNP